MKMRKSLRRGEIQTLRDTLQSLNKLVRTRARPRSAMERDLGRLGDWGSSSRHPIIHDSDEESVNMDDESEDSNDG